MYAYRTWPTGHKMPENDVLFGREGEELEGESQ